MPYGGGGKRRVREQAFANTYDSKLGAKRAQRREGQPMTGAASGRREASNEIMKRVMTSGGDPDFRNRPEIAAMRKRATDFKTNYRPRYESVEEHTRRLRRERERKR